MFQLDIPSSETGSVRRTIQPRLVSHLVQVNYFTHFFWRFLRDRDPISSDVLSDPTALHGGLAPELHCGLLPEIHGDSQNVFRIA